MPDAEPSPFFLGWYRPLKEMGGRFSLPKANTLRGVFYRFVWEGAFASVFTIPTQGGLLIAFATFLNASHWQVSLISAMVFVVMPMQSFLGKYLNHYESRKKNTLVTAVIGRFLWIGPMILAITYPQGAVWWLLLFVFLMNLSLTLSVLCWLSWVGDLISKEIRGRFFGARQRWMSVSNVILFISAGLFMDWMKSRHQEGLGYYFLGIVSLTAGIVSLYLMLQVPRRLREKDAVNSNEYGLSIAWKNHEYRLILYGFGGWYFAIGFAGPYWAVHMLTYLQFSFTLLTAYGALFTITMAFVSPIVGRWIDKKDDLMVLVIGMLCLASLSIFWIFITPSFLYPIIPEIIITAIGWSTIQITSSTIPLKYSNESTRNAYLSALAMVTGVGFTVGSIFGGWMMDSITSYRGLLFSVPLYPTHFAFAITAILRLSVAIYFFIFLKQITSRKLSESPVY